MEDLFTQFVLKNQDKKSFRVYTTGPLRALYYDTNGNHPIFTEIRNTAQKVKETHGLHDFSVEYLSNSDEVYYGFKTMLNDPTFFTEKIPLLFQGQQQIPHENILFIQSGTTTCQVMCYKCGGDDDDDDHDHVYEFFQFGAKNMKNTQEFERFCTWVKRENIQYIVDFGAHGYSIENGCILTNENNCLTENAAESCKRIYTFALNENIKYIVPHRKLIDIHTSPVDSIENPENSYVFLDWGGGQMQEKITKTKITFDQNILI